MSHRWRARKLRAEPGYFPRCLRPAVITSPPCHVSSRWSVSSWVWSHVETTGRRCRSPGMRRGRSFAATRGRAAAARSRGDSTARRAVDVRDRQGRLQLAGRRRRRHDLRRLGGSLLLRDRPRRLARDGSTRPARSSTRPRCSMIAGASTSGRATATLCAFDAKTGDVVWMFAADEPGGEQRAASTGSRATSRWASTARSSRRTTTSTSTGSIATATSAGAQTCRIRRGRRRRSTPRPAAFDRQQQRWSRCSARNLRASRPTGRSRGSTARRTARSPRARCSPPMAASSSAASTATSARYDPESGAERWAFATRDHIYASPAELPDGTIVQAVRATARVYALDPATGDERWQFDTLEPIRSSPAIDAAGQHLLRLRRGPALRARTRRHAALVDAADRRRSATISTRRRRSAATRSISAARAARCSACPTTTASAATGSPMRAACARHLPSDMAELWVTTQLGAPLAVAPADHRCEPRR